MSDLNLPSVVHEKVDEQTKRLVLGAAALAILISLAALILTLRRPETPVFVSVSMKSLVEEHMIATVGRNITQYEAELRTREFSNALNQAISELGGDRQVLVLASEAVIGASAPDFTEDIRTRTHALAREYAARRGVTLPSPGDRSGLNGVIGELSSETEVLRRRIEGPGADANVVEGEDAQ